MSPCPPVREAPVLGLYVFSIQARVSESSRLRLQPAAVIKIRAIANDRAILVDCIERSHLKPVFHLSSLPINHLKHRPLDLLKVGDNIKEIANLWIPFRPKHAHQGLRRTLQGLAQTNEA